MSSMKNLLNLVQEWAILDGAKTAGNGDLPPEAQERWQELKTFYDLLMVQSGIVDNPLGRFGVGTIRDVITERARLRVRTEFDTIVSDGATVHRALTSNISCGGAMLYSDAAFSPTATLSLELTGVGRGTEAQGKVVWLETSLSQRDFRLGVRFVDLKDRELRILDDFVLESLEAQLKSLPRDALDEAFLKKEKLLR